MKADDFEKLGFGEKQSQNLEDALQNSRKESIEDARFLAAFGLLHLGIGESRRLLRHHKLDTLNTLTAEDIDQIHGFGSTTAPAIAHQLKSAWPTIKHMKDLGFTLEATPLEAEFKKIESAISGKKLVFTGTMTSGDRSDMEDAARALGATVASSVTKSVDFLVAGPGAGSKLTKAQQYNIKVLDEAAYLKLIAPKDD